MKGRNWTRKGVTYDEVRGENLQAKAVIEKQRQNAWIPGTVEFQKMEKIKNNIWAHNNHWRAFKSKGIKSKKRIKTVENMYKYVKLTQRGKKGGNNWFLYQKYILIPHLYRFYEEVQALNPSAAF